MNLMVKSRLAETPTNTFAMAAELESKNAEIKLLHSLLRRSECILMDVAQEARAHGERDSIVEVLLQDIDLVLYPQAQQVDGIKLDLLVS